MSPDGSSQSPPPEEKLLRLIRGKPQPSVATAPYSGARQRDVSTASTIRAISAWPVSRLWSRGLMIVLGVALLIEAKLLVEDLQRPVAQFPNIEDGTFLPNQASDVPQLLSAPASLLASATRSLFVMPISEQPSTGQGTPQKTPPSVSIEQHQKAKELSLRLTLLGVISGSPAQVIIEDSKTNKTYFVTVGQEVVEEATVEQVLDNQVILDVAGEKITLTL